jgi:hypothetical protein
MTTRSSSIEARTRMAKVLGKMKKLRTTGMATPARARSADLSAATLR